MEMMGLRLVGGYESKPLILGEDMRLRTGNG